MMGSGVKLGRWFGITVRVDWSWLLIAFLITWNLASAFNDVHQGWSPLAIWGIALVAALLFFVSVLAHEFAHSLVARARGIPVRSITLFLFGGVSNIERDPDSPKSEFLITIVGPLTSFLIGGVLLALAAFTSPSINTRDAETALGSMGPLHTILWWLGSVNILLGVFNLIPGFPLDGGRVLRSILWASTGNLRRATRWASWVGQAVAWILIVLGVMMVFGATIPFFGSGLISGLWLAFIGWFLNSAAVQTYQRVVIQDILQDVPVARMMRLNPPTVRADVSVRTLVEDYVMRSDDQGFPVVENNQLVGMVTLDDIRRVPREAWDTTRVREIMTPLAKLAVVSANEDAAEAWTKLAQLDVRQLPVVRGTELAGLLRRRDLVRWLQLHSELSAS